MKRGVEKGYQKDNGRGASRFEPNLLKPGTLRLLVISSATLII
jgi:hypothetical protein